MKASGSDETIRLIIWILQLGKHVFHQAKRGFQRVTIWNMKSPTFSQVMNVALDLHTCMTPDASLVHGSNSVNEGPSHGDGGKRNAVELC